MTFAEGDAVWLMIDGVWQRGEVRTADEQSVQVRVSFGTEWRGVRRLVAESALGFAIEAVAKARDAVVDAAKTMRLAHDTHAGGKAGSIRLVLSMTKRLEALERVEAEARAGLEAAR